MVAVFMGCGSLSVEGMRVRGASGDADAAPRGGGDGVAGGVDRPGINRAVRGGASGIRVVADAGRGSPSALGFVGWPGGSVDAAGQAVTHVTVRPGGRD